MTGPLLEVRDLKKHYPITKGVLRREVGRVYAVDGVSFEVYPGETVGLVGESGCGKSTAATTILRLEEPTSGEVLFDGDDITKYNKRQLKRFRRRAQMIFQDPTSSFDPRMTIGESVGEPLRVHGINNPGRRRRIVKDLIERVGLSAGDVDRYPHEFSGGQKQRVALARALVVNPDLIVADEPVSALDVSIQATILKLMKDIQSEFNLSLLIISHDMGIIREISDRVAVMYLGEIVETGPTQEVFEDPGHPYTESLLASIPKPDPRQRGRTMALTGDVPDPSDPPPGCRFHTRCPAVVQPEGYDFLQGEWLGVLNLRVSLRDEGIDVSAIQGTVGGQRTGDPENVSTSVLKHAIRDEFEIPDRLQDPEAEAVMNESLNLIIDDEISQARSLMSKKFSTVCEREKPAAHRLAGRRLASCHLQDERYSVSAMEGLGSIQD